MMSAPPPHVMFTDLSALEDTGRDVLEHALREPACADVRINSHLVSGNPTRALLERAEGAGLVVVGTRGLGRVTSMLLGSVSRQLLHHAPCPVVVI